MASETIVGLVKDLTSQLSAIAVEFGARIDQVGEGTVEPPASPLRRSHRDIARKLLDQRAARFNFFPADLFHEPAWDMLLALFVAHEEQRSLNIKALVSCAQAPVTTSQRWIEHLHQLKLINRIVDPADRRRIEISLTDTGERTIRDYIERIDNGDSRP